MANTNLNKILVFASIAALFAHDVYAQTYRSEKLKAIAKQISLSPSIGDGEVGYADAGYYHSLPITIGKDKDQTINHIGFKLFPTNMKTDYPSDVYDFVERYLLELQCLPSTFGQERRLSDDKVIILQGSLAKLSAIKPDTQCLISLVDNKYYDVSWKDQDATILELAFPISYELLLGMPKVEIEKMMCKFLSSESFFNSKKDEDAELDSIGNNIYRTKPVSNYYVESLNNARYYSKTLEGKFYPIFSSSEKWESSANLFQGLIGDIAGYKLYIQQNLYGFEQDTYTVTLENWVSYCQKNDLTVYYAVEEEHEDGLKALLIAQSEKLGFNHMLSIILPDNFVDNPHTIIKATLNAFIPTQNVKDLYKQYTVKPKKKY